jgi:hypothetical protein
MKKNAQAQAAGRLGGQAKSAKKTAANRKKAETTSRLWKAMKTVLAKPHA